MLVNGNGSPKQLAWIERMIEGKDISSLPENYQARIAEIAAGAPIKSARELIDALKDLPWKKRGAGA